MPWYLLLAECLLLMDVDRGVVRGLALARPFDYLPSDTAMVFVCFEACVAFCRVHPASVSVFQACLECLVPISHITLLPFQYFHGLVLILDCIAA